MFYLPLIVIAAIGIFAMTRNAPRRATAIGITAVAIGALLLGAAALRGGLLLGYLGAFTWPIGAVLLILLAIDRFRRRRSDRSQGSR